jgi:SPX domain protein involved in polyphosphate accumulation
MSNSNSFVRSENKFVVLEKSFVEIFKSLEKNMLVDSFKKDSVITLIKSIYLDDDKFSLFREYLSKRKFRFKIRFRNYGHDFKFDEDDFWAEFKVKYKKISRKERFLISPAIFKPFLNGENVEAEIMRLNNNSEKVLQVYRVMSELIKLNNLHPVLTTTYERVAFTDESKDVRITVDRNIKHHSHDDKKKTNKLHAIVCETKIHGEPPEWYYTLVNELSLLQQKRFSKYATGINSVYFPARGTYNFYTNFAESKTISDRMGKNLEFLKKAFDLEKE